MKVDYSQFGQSLLLERLIANDTPRILVDIGANDGICGSNSRTLLENGWRGCLVEPLPQVFEKLKENSAGLPNVCLRQAACSDKNGRARIRIGRDGDLGQMSSLSQDPNLLQNLSDHFIEVETVTLANLLAAEKIPEDFGVLLVDTEGWDLTVLKGLQHTRARPRIIVTEEFVGTNEEKYRFLASIGYRYAGVWGSDSFWIYGPAAANLPAFAPPIDRCPSDWVPRGRDAGAAHSMLDASSFFGNSVAGWAWTELNSPPPQEIFVALNPSAGGERLTFAAWRNPRPDVAEVFQSQALLFSGFRAYIDVAPGEYEISVIQQDQDRFSNNHMGRLAWPLR